MSVFGELLKEVAESVVRDGLIMTWRNLTSKKQPRINPARKSVLAKRANNRRNRRANRG